MEINLFIRFFVEKNTMRKTKLLLFTITLFTFLLTSCSTTQSVVDLPKQHDVRQSKRGKKKQINALIKYAKRYQGVPYKYAGKGPKNFDCSGFTRYVFRHFGYSLPGYSRGQATKGKKIATKKIKKGDLVFFTGRKTGNKVGHVGLVISANKRSFQFIHASLKGIKINSYPEDTYYKKHFKFARRIIP